MYKKSFHKFQEKYMLKNKNSLKMRDFLDKINKDISKLSILDVGCGSGLDIKYFNKLGFKKISGIDITGSLVDIARKNNPYAELVHGTFHNLEWQNNSFDIVWSKYALQVESNIDKSIKEIYRVLKKDGLALIQVTHPFRTSEMTQTKNYFDRQKIIYKSIDDKKIFFEEYHFIVSDWINTFIKNGFNIINIDEILNKNIDQYSGHITPSALIFVLEKI